jgi:hypothetical protein
MLVPCCSGTTGLPQGPARSQSHALWSVEQLTFRVCVPILSTFLDARRAVLCLAVKRFQGFPGPDGSACEERSRLKSRITLSGPNRCREWSKALVRCGHSPPCANRSLWSVLRSRILDKPSCRALGSVFVRALERTGYSAQSMIVPWWQRASILPGLSSPCEA